MRSMLRFLFAAVLAAPLAAQSDRGNLAGTVTDQAGAAVPGARVTAVRQDTNTAYKGSTTEAGEFNLPSLPVGRYRVTIEAEGFTSFAAGELRIEAGGTQRITARLEIGAVQQTIEVSAVATQLQADDAKVQNTVPDFMIESLPTVVSDNMRSPFDLANLTAGVSGGDQDFRIGGGQQGSFGVMLDGSSANTNRAGSTLWAAVNAPSIEAITEFAVETNGFKAEFGRAGGGLISFVSRSGTNKYHGSAFDYIRNNAFDARGFFNRTTPVYRQHDFGATFGGPVRIPKLYRGANRTFFFFSYEGFRNRIGGNTNAIAIPPAEFYEGDFRNAVSRTRNEDGSYIRYLVYDPATTRYDPEITQYVREPFPDNRVPKARFDPMAVKLAAIAQSTLKPLRTDVVPGTPEHWLENFWQGGTSIRPNNKFSIKIDHALTDYHRLSGYIGYSKREVAPGPSGFNGIPGLLNTTLRLRDTSPVYRVNWDWTISPRMHNRFNFGLNKFLDGNYPLSEAGGWKAKGACIPNVPDCDRNLPRLIIADYGNWGGLGFNGSENPSYTFKDDLSWIRGRHVFKMGYLYEYAPYVGLGQQYGAGQVNFGTNTTALPGQSNRNVGGGVAFASFLLGLANNGRVMTPKRTDMRWRYHAMYFQDDWRMTPRLTVNLGLRYEFNLPALNGDDRCADFNPAKPNPGAGNRPGALDFCGIGPGRVGRHSIPPGWFRGFGPRLGFAWNAMRRTVVRGSAGASYAPVKAVAGSAHAQGFQTDMTFPDQTNGITPVFRLSEGLPPWPQPPFINPTFANNGEADWWQGKEANRLPEMWSWTLTIQRELGKAGRGATLVEAGYSAIIGTHLIANLLNYNQVDVNTLPPVLDIFTPYGRQVLNTAFNNRNRLVQINGFEKPYDEFPNTYTLARALRPYPQYNTVNTGNSGDHSGHSTYHSLMVKVTRRYAANLMVDASYVLSKMFTDSDSVWGSGAARDHFNRRLEKALSAADRTHEAKINFVYELPIGPRKRWLRSGLLAQAIGGWRIGATQRYASGTPIAFTGAYGFPLIGNRPYITQYDDWRAPLAGDKFDPYVDRYFRPPTTASWTTSGSGPSAVDVPRITQEGWFPLQPRDRLGNMTRNNPKMRNFCFYNEDVSLAKTFTLPSARDTRREVAVRFEAFNVTNRTRFGTPNTNLNDAANLGLVRSQANSPRRMQFALKLSW